MSLGKRRRRVRRRVCCRRVRALGPRATSLFPAGAGGWGGRGRRRPHRGAGLSSCSTPSSRRRRRRLGAGPPLPRPFPRFGPSPPARARTQASPGSMQMRYPGAGGPGRGEGGKGVVLVRAPERAPGTCSLLLFCPLHTPTSRLAERSGLVRADPPPGSPCRQCPRAAHWPPHPECPPACGLSHSRLTSTRRTGLWGALGGEGRRATLTS